MDLEELRRQNLTCCNRWHPGGIVEWSLSDWAVAAAGEMGAAAPSGGMAPGSTLPAFRMRPLEHLVSVLASVNHRVITGDVSAWCAAEMSNAAKVLRQGKAAMPRDKLRLLNSNLAYFPRNNRSPHIRELAVHHQVGPCRRRPEAN